MTTLRRSLTAAAMTLAITVPGAMLPADAAPADAAPADGQRKTAASHRAKPKPAPTATVTTDNETPTLYDDKAGGNASGDDPAIWVDARHSANSLVIVTAKKGGLRVYDMHDRELQSLPASALPNPGRYNNVDIAYGVRVAGRIVDLAVVSDRYNDSLRFFTIDRAGARAKTPLREVTSPKHDYLFVKDAAELADEHTAYGLAVWQNGRDTYAVVTQEGTTRLALARVVAKRDGTVGYEKVRTWTMPASFTLPNGKTWTPCEEPGVGPQLEGVSVDRKTGTLYAAQEDVGLWRIELTRPYARPVLVDRTTTFGTPATFDAKTEECVAGPDAGFGGRIVADAEGVDLYYGRGKTGYVVVSAQGSDEFLVYERQGRNRYAGKFKVAGTGGVDDINGSDGLAIASRPVGEYTRGLLVTHDEPDTGPSVDADRDPTNFSYVQWGDVADALHLKHSR
ncbi:phytase [Nigerium massiliense]|uniref:phytase n=1 Tax=Nigerium massiliense TaxID=1522317 RepID=UPI00058C6371|nr:phytase [Nigerium massiliense]